MKCPLLSGLQKSSELEKSKEWHLSSDGTTLKQQKKMAFLINGLVFGIHDVPDGSSQAALNALKSELKKLEGLSHNTLPFDHFVSCTGDGASTQTKFNQLVEREAGKERGALIENKCSMHLGVNLRCAQVRAMKSTVLKNGSDDGVYGHDIDISESINSEIENEENCESEFEARKRSEKRLSSMPNGHIGKEKEASKLKKSDDNIDDVACQISVQRDGESCHGNVNEGTKENYDSEFEVNEERFDGHTSEIEEDIRDMDPDVVHNKCVQYETDVDRFVHEICKLFGHLGTPEYGQGAAFRIFLAKECDGDDQDYYQCTKNVYLK